jgi:hypothetical protein
VVEPLGDEVQVSRPLPGLAIRNSLYRRDCGIVETETRRELDGDRAPLAPGRPEIIGERPVHIGDTNPLAARPLTRCSLSGSDHHGSAETYRVEHPVSLASATFRQANTKGASDTDTLDDLCARNTIRRILGKRVARLFVRVVRAGVI